jgi:hypothetical protein
LFNFRNDRHYYLYKVPLFLTLCEMFFQTLFHVYSLLSWKLAVLILYRLLDQINCDWFSYLTSHLSNIISHAPNWPDLVPCDFRLNDYIKRNLTEEVNDKALVQATPKIVKDISGKMILECWTMQYDIRWNKRFSPQQCLSWIIVSWLIETKQSSHSHKWLQHKTSRAK